MRSIACLIACLFLSISLFAQSLFKHGRLQVTKDGHDLQFTDGQPFFWLGDTGWELFHRLNLGEIKQYLDNRAAKGFTVIQAVALAEFDGLRKPNRYGDLPLKDLDPANPNDKYFNVIDSTIHMARQRNLFIGLLPTWGDKVTKLWGEGPVVFDSINAYTYGKWIGNRYKKEPNIIWLLGGDRPAVKDSNDWRPVWRAMAKGIIEATNHQCFITYHPWGGENSTSQWIHNEAWLDMNMFQSGHGGGHDVACWDLVKRDRSYTPAKPTLDGEPNYEDHPVNPWPKWNPDNGYYRDYDVRKQTYRSVFAGACGVTYGHHAVWQFMSEREETINYPDRGWVNAMDRPGAFQVGYLRKLITSRPMLQRVPDNSIITQGQGEKGEHMEAFHAADNSYVMIYLPVGKTITVNTANITGKIIAWWFNPKNAEVQQITVAEKMNSMEFTSPTTGTGNDWVLVIDDASKGYKVPGK
ncbi:MAG TPA: glycoside hydrolase family 140 protein [Panacibacter sp.]|nr:glycoside hydrolase family 140 protein [Panacibacter sp.]